MAKKIFGYGNFFCSNCGDRVEKDKMKCQVCGTWYSGKRKYENIPAAGAGGIGWSDKVNDSRYAKYDRGYRRYSYIWATALSIIVPSIMLATGDIKLDKEGTTVIVVIIGLFWLFCLGFLFFSRKKIPEWDGRVENKQIFQRERKVKDSYNGYRIEQYTEYIVTFRCTGGSINEQKYSDDSTKYDYYRIGDYVHYHSKRHLSALEKYDKTFDEILFCVKCSQINDVRSNYCSSCGCPLLKGTSQNQPPPTNNKNKEVS